MRIALSCHIEFASYLKLVLTLAQQLVFELRHDELWRAAALRTHESEARGQISQQLLIFAQFSSLAASLFLF